MARSINSLTNRKVRIMLTYLFAHTNRNALKSGRLGGKAPKCVRTSRFCLEGIFHFKAVLRTLAVASFCGRSEEKRVRLIKGGARVELITGIERKTSKGKFTAQADRTPVTGAGQSECNPSGNVGILILNAGMYRLKSLCPCAI